MHDGVLKKWITPLNKAGLPGGFPNSTFPGKYVANNGETATVALTTYGIAYNTSLVKKAPTTWTDLLDSQYSGKLAGQNPVQGGQANFEVWDFLDQTYGDSYLTKFKAQHPRWENGAVPGAQSVGSGESVAALGAVQQVIAPVKSAGAPIGFVVPTPTTFAQQYVGISTNAAHPNAARLFAYWLLSADGGRTWNSVPGNTSPYDSQFGKNLVTPRSSEAATPSVRAKIAKLLGL
jgi:ABC-type Fe3+ transport system substrate-binding protein